MCGICLFIYQSTTDAAQLHKITESLLGSRLGRRGPDVQTTLQHELTSAAHAVLHGCTLHFRGNVTKQPIQQPTGDLLLWNGEIFNGLQVSMADNDGVKLLNELSKCASDIDVLRLFSIIHGPWAFIYWQKKYEKLWFGRDIFGRRSLLYNNSTDGQFALSSIAVKPWTGWKELPAVGIYCAGLEPRPLDTPDTSHYPLHHVTLYPWAKPSTSVTSGVRQGSDVFNQTLMSEGPPMGDLDVEISETMIISGIQPFNTHIHDVHATQAPEEIATISSLATDHHVTLSTQLIALLEQAVGVRTQSQSDRCSDCIQTLLERQQSSMRITPTSMDIEGNGNMKTSSEKGKRTTIIPPGEVHSKGNLENAFCGELQSEKDTNCASSASENLCDSNSMEETHNEKSIEERFDTLECTVSNSNPNSDDGRVKKNDNSASSSKLLQESNSSKSRHEFKNTESYSEPVSFNKCSGYAKKDSTTKQQPGCGHARVAVLFSGGIDSLVIAALADRTVPPGEPIDLLNVAFEQKPKLQQGKKPKTLQPTPTSNYNVPDRITGLEGLDQLQNLNPQRTWNFVQIDVPLSELDETRTSCIRDLVHPLHSVLDDSIGCAIWFAARGQGVIRPDRSHGAMIDQSEDGIPYRSLARVVLVGMGADEQLVGYSRHRVKFNTSGLAGLLQEINMEVERISSRNLGRDDRVISDSGRESRFPFLDEEVVSFLNSLHIQDKADLTLPRGVGEKFLLRLAAERIGLARGALAPKRAIQFGSRIAKAENRREKGSDTCGRLGSEAGTLI